RRRALRADRALVPASGAARLRAAPTEQPTPCRGRQVALDCPERAPTGVRVCRARGAGGAPRSGKCGALQGFLGLAHVWSRRRARAASSLVVGGRPVYASPMKLALLGGGRMGEALARGLVDAGWDADGIAIAEIDSDRRHAL